MKGIHHNKLISVLSNSLNSYSSEDPRFIDAGLYEVLVVGSLATGEFVQSQSDVDLLVFVSGASKQKDTYDGFANYLREDCANDILSSIRIRATGFDIAVYDENVFPTYVDDDKAYSVLSQKYVNTIYKR